MFVFLFNILKLATVTFVCLIPRHWRLWSKFWPTIFVRASIINIKTLFWDLKHSFLSLFLLLSGWLLIAFPGDFILHGGVYWGWTRLTTPHALQARVHPDLWWALMVREDLIQVQVRGAGRVSTTCASILFQRKYGVLLKPKRFAQMLLLYLRKVEDLVCTCVLIILTKPYWVSLGLNNFSGLVNSTWRAGLLLARHLSKLNDLQQVMIVDLTYARLWCLRSNIFVILALWLLVLMRKKSGNLLLHKSIQGLPREKCLFLSGSAGVLLDLRNIVVLFLWRGDGYLDRWVDLGMPLLASLIGLYLS